MVMEIWRYPVKSAQGESLASVFVGLDGPDGDRSWAAVASDGLIADWVATARPGEDAVTPITGARPGGRFVDSGAVHVVTTDELAQLEREGVEVDVRRFRPNLVLTLERTLSVGDV